jgi:hypothetical protein
MERKFRQERVAQYKRGEKVPPHPGKKSCKTCGQVHLPSEHRDHAASAGKVTAATLVARQMGYERASEVPDSKLEDFTRRLGKLTGTCACPH